MGKINVKRFVSAAAIALLLCSCGHKQSKEQPKVASVRTITLGQTATDGGDHTYVGTVVESAATVLSFEVAGNVSSLRVDEGDRVRRGQLLATVTPTTLRDAHYEAVVTLKQAQDAYKRMLPLHKQGVISDMKFVDVETKLEQAKAAERIAREQLSHSSLTAPADGVIAQRSVEVGTNVMPGQQVFKLVDVAKVDVTVSIPEKNIAAIRKGMQARVVVNALGGATFTAQVTEIGVEANPLSHTYDVKLAVANPQGRLMPGMVCNVALGSAAMSTDKIVIPLGAVELDTSNARFVWVVEGDKAVKRPIVVGDFSGDGVVVLSGLAVGDHLIVDGSQKVSQGMRVKEATQSQDQ